MKYHDLFVSSFILVSASVTKLLMILSNKFWVACWSSALFQNCHESGVKVKYISTHLISNETLSASLTVTFFFFFAMVNLCWITITFDSEMIDFDPHEVPSCGRRFPRIWCFYNQHFNTSSTSALLVTLPTCSFHSMCIEIFLS